MRYILIIFLVASLFSCDQNSPTYRSEKRILIYSTPTGWQDQNNNTIYNSLNKAAENEGIQIDSAHTTTSLWEENIKNYSACIILGTEVSHFDPRTQSDIERYVEAGGGFLGIDVSLKSKYYWPWLNHILNAEPDVTEGKMEAISINAKDQLNLSERLIRLIGDNSIDYNSVTTQRAPDPNRYIREVLDNNIDEPMKMSVLPDGKVLFIERRGKVKLYNPVLGNTKTISEFKVRLDGNYEDGMLGLELDPQFERNGYIYIYYSPFNTAIQSLSRFLLVEDSLIRSTEKVVLEVPVQIETCCHSGGDVVFGPDGLLYLSTGDNTSSKESDGYSPIDERPGRSPFDAQKSSSNTNDLRGKILRIKPEPDGSYSIPDGNLFAKDGSEGRPEIYAMGLRNPFRFTIHQKHNDVYWGEVGPDSGSDGKYGPRSYDEFNRAKTAGNFGWPYFQGDNKPYPDRNFETDEVGELFDPNHPINDSPFNTGAKALPPAQPSLIWYPYDQSKEFPMLGTGSRSALGGPFYYADEHDNSPLKFSGYYDGKWFIYDWARSWIKVVSFDENDEMIKIEPFMSNNEFHKPIDMEFGPDGSLYILEYGANYFANNNDAFLLKIGYAGGNLAPIPRITADKTVGANPLTVTFSGASSFDYDENDLLTYAWKFTKDEVQSEYIETSFTFDNPGKYNVVLTATDRHGESASTSIPIIVGNERPQISIDFEGNRSFYFENETIGYKVNVHDLEDSKNGNINENEVNVNFSYLNSGLDLANLPADVIIASTTNLKGKTLIEDSDCKTCHSIDKKSVGPTYQEIAVRYDNKPEVITMLGKKIIEGGNGNWGHSLMAAHPQHSLEETSEMVDYILKLNDSATGGQLPLSGQIAMDKHLPYATKGMYIFQAMYTDKGANGIEPLLANELLVLKSPIVRAEHYDDFKDAAKFRISNTSEASFVLFRNDSSWISFNQIDLFEVKNIELEYSTNNTCSISLHIGSADGPLISKVDIQPMLNTRSERKKVSMSVPDQQSKLQSLYFVINGDFNGGKALALESITFKK